MKLIKHLYKQQGRIGTLILVIVLAATLIIVSSVFYKLVKNFSKNPTPSGIVTITKSNLIPSTITIRKGQTILFINKDKLDHKIASGPFPSHVYLPKFTSMKLKTGSSYLFTFDQTGIFNYQDDLNPYTLKGIVIVK